MSEVVGRPDDLAERIDAEHRACLAAANAALDHALAAGELLVRAKERHGKHGKWTVWLERNFDWSPRTARAYMQLWRNRKVVEEVKRQGVANLGVGEALRRVAIAATHSGPLWGLEGVPGPPEGAKIDPDVERGLEEERELILAWERSNKEKLAEMRAEERLQRAAAALGPVANGLYRLAHPREGFRPEEAGEALALIGDARQIAALRNCVAWLTRVIEAAEAER